MSVAPKLTQARPEERAAFHGTTPRVKSLTATELVNLKLPPLESFLAPWLSQKCLAMVHSKRGVGKTHFGLGVADAVSSGGQFLGWKAEKARRVLFLDGEMPVQLMQQRLSEQAGRRGSVPELLRIVTPDLQDAPLPDLGTLAGQVEIDRVIEEWNAELVIVDNISCFVRSGGAENEAESWGFVSEWALAHRRAGRALIFVHHSGKTGTQRGTSRREDLLDIVINLRRPNEYQEPDGARFEVHFEKARSIFGDDILPIEAKLERLPGDELEWTWRAVDTVRTNSVLVLWEGGGVTITDIAREIGLHKSNVHRTLQAAMQADQLTRPYPSKPRSKGEVAPGKK